MRRGLTSLRVLFLACTVATTLLTTSTPASACSCEFLGVEHEVESAEAVHVAHPRWPDPWPDRSFRVEETLKGPPRHNLRVDVDWDPGSSCHFEVVNEPYVLTVDGDGVARLHACDENMAGHVAVAEARQILGDGTRMGWRPDLLWTAQYVAMAVLLAGGIAALVRAARNDRRWIVEKS